MTKEHNDLVLARMRVREFIDGDMAALDKLDGLSREARLTACFEALVSDTSDTPSRPAA